MGHWPTTSSRIVGPTFRRHVRTLNTRACGYHLLRDCTGSPHAGDVSACVNLSGLIHKRRLISSTCAPAGFLLRGFSFMRPAQPMQENYADRIDFC